MSQVDPRVQNIPATEADRVATLIKQMRAQGKFQEKGDPEVDTTTQEGLGQGLDPRFLDITPDVMAAHGPANAWDAYTRMGGGRASYTLVTTHPDITSATAPTPDMLAADRAGGAEDPEAWRNTPHFPG